MLRLMLFASVMFVLSAQAWGQGHHPGRAEHMWQKRLHHEKLRQMTPEERHRYLEQHPYLRSLYH